jgi:hypothetical protein
MNTGRMRYGYTRTYGQGAARRLAVANEKLAAAGATVLVRDFSPPGAPARGLRGVPDKMGPGDELVTCSVVDNGLSQMDLIHFFETLAERDAVVTLLDETVSIPAVAMAALLRSFKALPTVHVAGRGRGRPPKLDKAAVAHARRALGERNVSVATVAGEMGVNATTLYRALKRTSAAR